MISTIIAAVLVGVATASVYETDDRKYSKLCISVPMTYTDSNIRYMLSL